MGPENNLRNGDRFEEVGYKLDVNPLTTNPKVVVYLWAKSDRHSKLGITIPIFKQIYI